MKSGVEKYTIMWKYMQFHLALENSYHDKARALFLEINKNLDDFYTKKKISRHYYKKMKKELQQYQLMYNGIDICKTSKNWNKKAYIVNREHFE